MSQINIKVLKQGTPSDKILSTSFFTMKSAYRSFDKYIRNLKRMIENSRGLKGFETRIYTDDTGADIALDAAEKYPDVSVYHFDCEPFREGEGHVGTFGTLVRFLPMFEEGLSTVFITDIDVDKNWFSNSIVKRVSQYDIFAENRICYERKPWNSGKKHPFVAYRMIFNVTFPRRLLTHYITKLSNGSYKDEIAAVNEWNSSRKDYKPPNDIFPYGMDEYFLNTTLYEYIRSKDMKCLFRKYYELYRWLGSSYSNLTEKEIKIVWNNVINPTKETMDKARSVYRKGIQHFQQLDPDRYKCFGEVLQLLDKFKDEMVAWSSVSGKDI